MIDEHDVTWMLEPRKFRLTVIEYLIPCERLPFLESDNCAARLPEALIRNPDDRGFADLVEFVEKVLDLCRIDILAARDVHVVQPVFDVDESLSIARADVARAEPTLDEGLFVGFRPAPVAGRDGRPPTPDLAGFTRIRFAAVLT
jgi:hypothetical protein